MPQIVAQVPHQLGKVEAEARLQQLADQLTSRYPTQIHFPDCKWEDDAMCVSFTTYGFRVNWQLSALNHCIDMTAEIPVAARMFELKLEQAMVHCVDDCMNANESQTRRAA
jgi:hypothetical protein